MVVFFNLLCLTASIHADIRIWRQPLRNKYKVQGNVMTGGTPNTSLWHPGVPRHPGGEPQ